jgi:hypothetical protein
MSSALELTQVCVRDLGPRSKLAEREPRELALRVDELAERFDLLLPRIGQWTYAFVVVDGLPSTGEAASSTLSANSFCAFSSCSANPKLVLMISCGFGSSSE